MASALGFVGLRRGGLEGTSRRLKSELLLWMPQDAFAAGLAKAVAWYLPR